MCVLLDCCLCLNTAWQLDYLITWLLWCGAWSVFQCCLATTMLPNHAAIIPCYHTIMLLRYLYILMLLGSAYLWSRFPPAWWQVTRWSKDGRRWPRDEKRRKFPTSFQHLRERPPSWQSGPDQVQYCALLFMQIQILPEPNAHNSLTVPLIHLLQVLHRSKTSWECLFDFSTDDCDLMHFVSPSSQHLTCKKI